jgi:hypothetical protein
VAKTLKELAWAMLDELKANMRDGVLHPITYADASRRAGVDPVKYSRATGQAASLLDAASFWAKRPFLAAAFVRLNDGSINKASFADYRHGNWPDHRDVLLKASISKAWADDDLEKIRRVLITLADSASGAWEDIFDKCGDKAINLAYGYAGLARP